LRIEENTMIEAPKDQDRAPSTSLEIATSRTIAKRCPKMPPDEREARAKQFVAKGAVFLCADLSVGVMPNAEARNLVMQSCPALLGESVDPALDERTPRQKLADRLWEAERVLAGRGAASRAPKPKIQDLVNEQVTAAKEANPAMQGTSERAKILRAGARETSTLAVLDPQGRGVRALRFDGVS
jgi:hypothetical protein